MRNQDKDGSIQYIEKTFVRESQTMVEIRRQAEELGRAGMQVSPYEGRLLQVLAKSIQAKTAVEIGLFLGYSTLWLAGSVDQIFTFEKEPKNAALALENFQKAGIAGQIQVFVGEAIEKLREIEDHGPFDLVFIDANKAAYPEYLAWAYRHLRPGGMVIGDNSFLFGHALSEIQPKDVSPAQWQGMRHFNEELADESRWMSILIPTAEGLTVGIKL